MENGWWIGGWKDTAGGSSLSPRKGMMYDLSVPPLCGGEIFNPPSPPSLLHLSVLKSLSCPAVTSSLPRELMVTVFIKMTVMHSRKLDPSVRLGSSFLFRSPLPLTYDVTLLFRMIFPRNIDFSFFFTPPIFAGEIDEGSKVINSGCTPPHIFYTGNNIFCYAPNG